MESEKCTSAYTVCSAQLSLLCRAVKFHDELMDQSSMMLDKDMLYVPREMQQSLAGDLD